MAQDKRGEQRHPFHWKAVIVLGEPPAHTAYQGETLEVSLSGCSVLIEHNLPVGLPATIVVSVPAEKAGGSMRIVEATCRMVYTVLSSSHHKFRCGIQFVDFKDEGRTVWRSAVEARVRKHWE
jgi:c-di-GMP-binding flagellar brake protein YcgR